MLGVDAVLGQLQKVRKHPGYWTARCPSHHDKNPSLSITETPEAVLLHCFSGCSLDDVCHALGIDRRELFASRDPELPVLQETYDYRDEGGQVLYQVLRYFPKAFKQRRPAGDSFVWDLEGIRRVPYCFPELREAMEAGRWVFLVEGEKDVERLAEEGKAATTIAGGAQSWKPEYAQWFIGALVAILPDNDEPGAAFARTAARDISTVAKAVRIVNLDVKPKGDVSNWLISHEVTELEALVKTAPNWSGSVAVTYLDDSIRLAWADEGILASFSRIKEKDDQVTCELAISTQDNKIFRGRVNLLAPRTIKTIANSLADRAAGVDWPSLLSDAASRVVDLYRDGSPPLDMREFTDPGNGEWLLEPYLEQLGTTLLYGQGGIGKGWFALAAALTVASGKPLVGEPSLVGPVLYLDWEADPTETFRRIEKLCAGAGINRPALFYRYETASLYSIVDAIARFVVDQRIVLVVVDSVGMARAGAPESAEDTIRLFSAMRRLRVPVLAIDHLSKQMINGRAAKMAFGSVYSTNAARIAWLAEGNERDGTVSLQLRNTKRNNGPKARPRAVSVTMKGRRAELSIGDLERITQRVIEDSETNLADRLVALIRLLGPLTNRVAGEKLGVESDVIGLTARRRKHLFVNISSGRDNIWALVDSNEGLWTPPTDVQGELPDPF